MLISCLTRVQYHNRESDIDIIHRFYSGFANFIQNHLCIYFCTILSCVVSCDNQYSHDTEKFHHKALLWTLHTYSYFLPTTTTIPNTWQPLICSLFLFLSFQKCYVNEIMQYVNFWYYLFTLSIIPLKTHPSCCACH